MPGLRDNGTLGIRRGRFRLSGSDVRAIFEPVVKEVIALVKCQIAATKTKITAILLVGGFGQNTFLRDSVRQAVAANDIEVMQSPNGYLPFCPF